MFIYTPTPKYQKKIYFSVPLTMNCSNSSFLVLKILNNSIKNLKQTFSNILNAEIKVLKTEFDPRLVKYCTSLINRI